MPNALAGGPRLNDAQLRAATREYQAARPHFDAYREFLEGLLKALCARVDPLAAVQGRTKSLGSFAEKTLRKGYSDPLQQMKDLCGLRVIVSEPRALGQLDQLIRDCLDVDPEHSIDKRSVLHTSEFGYLSLHFVVRVPQGRDWPAEQAPRLQALEAGPDGKLLVGEKRRCAEIQVRSQLQHAWADACHDRTYKTKLRIPERYRREVSRLAAILEEADESLARITEAVDAYQLDYGAYMSEGEMVSELETLRLLLEQEDVEAKERPRIALRLAKVAKALGRWNTVVEVTEKVVPSGGRLRHELQLELGYGRCRQAISTEEVQIALTESVARAAQFAEGRRTLEGVVRELVDERVLADPVLQARALARLGWAEWMTGDEADALRHAARACELDPKNPYHLKALLEYELRAGTDPERLRSIATPQMEAAIATCGEHAEVRTELPYAYFARGFLELLVGRSKEAMLAYAQAVASSSGCYAIEEEIATIERLQQRLGGVRLPKLGQVRQLLLLGLLARSGMTRGAEVAARGDCSPELRSSAVRRKLATFLGASADGAAVEKLRDPVVIVVGGARGQAETKEGPHYYSLLMEAFRLFPGTVFCGGTREGIPGCVGDVATALRQSGGFDLLTYLPPTWPADATRHDAYRVLDAGPHPSPLEGSGFTFREPILNWIHILLAGIDPTSVRVLGINGGDISKFEYYLALALGARVGLISDSGRAAGALLREEPWWRTGQLAALPEDPSTVTAFVYSGEAPLVATKITDQADAGKPLCDQDNDRGRLERAAKRAHELYEELTPASRTRWEELREDFRVSSRHQVVYAHRILRACGFEVHPKGPDSTLLRLEKSSAEVERMAEAEHGRWNAERLAQGWRFEKQTDRGSKAHNKLVAWTELDEKTKDYDRRAVLSFPEVLWEQGFEVRRAAGRESS